MVCVPCIVIPFFLFIWHKFLQPYFLKFWNPWKKVEERDPKQPIKLSCPMKSKVTEENAESEGTCPVSQQSVHTASDKKTD